MPTKFPFFENHSSTKGHRKAERFEIAAELIKKGVPSTALPMKVVQAFASIFTFFRKDTQPFEKLIHLLQTITSLFLIFMFTYKLFTDETCEKPGSSTCKLNSILEQFYMGLVFVAWAHSEVDKKNDGIQINNNNQRNDNDLDAVIIDGNSEEEDSDNEPEQTP